MGDLSKNFSRKEFACKCKNDCNHDTVDVDLLSVLQTTADYFDSAVTITSAHRCAQHNDAVGGSKNSQHLRGRAADIVVFDVAPNKVQNYLLRVYNDQYGIGRYDHFTHIDTRSGPAARWDLRTK
jgi:uncharacterized protein YcbK (DUF882 family)